MKGRGRKGKEEQREKRKERGKEGNISMNITVYNSFTYIHAH